MDTRTAIFWSDFADKYASDEHAAKAIGRIARVPVGAARETIAAAREHLRDPLFNRPVAREIIRDILDKAAKIDS